jgi:hypothetical protein
VARWTKASISPGVPPAATALSTAATAPAL